MNADPDYDEAIRSALERSEKALEGGVAVDPLTALALLREMVSIVKWLRGRNG